MLQDRLQNFVVVCFIGVKEFGGILYIGILKSLMFITFTYPH